MNHLIVFFAWQTDRPDRTNRRAIRNALRAAFSKLEEEFAANELDLELHEATRGDPGSPNIPSRILEKIDRSDIFVCDLTTITTPTIGLSRPTPNPNVIFELGYAIARVGWARTIMLFNTAFGTFPTDLPFDIDRHRASPYKIENDISATKAATRAHLDSLLIDALKAIIEAAPEKPASAKESGEELRRSRDVENLRLALAPIHWPTLDQHMQEAPYIVSGRVLHFWEGFNSVINDSLFYLYDDAVLAKLLKFYELWRKTVSFGHFYNPSRHSDRYIFGMEMDTLRTPEQRAAWKQLTKAIKELRPAADACLKYVREKYPEIDINALSRNAWNEYVDFEREMARRLKSE